MRGFFVGPAFLSVVVADTAHAVKTYLVYLNESPIFIECTLCCKSPYKQGLKTLN